MKKEKSPIACQPKMAALIKMMRRPKGATEAQLAKANEWLTHTTRAEICRQRQAGIVIETVRATGAETLYHVIGKAKRAAAPKPLGPLMAESAPRKPRKAKRTAKKGKA
jgi:hypothetical protein